tara:strand:+ start:925 stop:1038 length:114 start_codon:yes stop_codon:yes gene_type:complete
MQVNDAQKVNPLEDKQKWFETLLIVQEWIYEMKPTWR